MRESEVLLEEYSMFRPWSGSPCPRAQKQWSSLRGCRETLLVPTGVPHLLVLIEARATCTDFLPHLLSSIFEELQIQVCPHVK